MDKKDERRKKELIEELKKEIESLDSLKKRKRKKEEWKRELKRKTGYKD